jgi:hypothetical protein
MPMGRMDIVRSTTPKLLGSCLHFYVNNCQLKKIQEKSEEKVRKSQEKKPKKPRQPH